jgi:hypothetical protein
VCDLLTKVIGRWSLSTNIKCRLIQPNSIQFFLYSTNRLFSHVEASSISSCKLFEPWLCCVGSQSQNLWYFRPVTFVNKSAVPYALCFRCLCVFQGGLRIAADVMRAVTLAIYNNDPTKPHANSIDLKSCHPLLYQPKVDIKACAYLFESTST